MARFVRERGHILRFIEYMDVGHSNGWRLDEVVPAAEIVAIDRRRDAARSPCRRIPGRGRRPLALPRRRGRGRRHRSVTRAVLRRPAPAPASPRRGSCSRACSASAARPASPLRDRAPTTTRLRRLIGSAWAARTDRYSELRSDATTPLAKVEMSRNRWLRLCWPTDERVLTGRHGHDRRRPTALARSARPDR